jgi:hypothetical protein
MVCGKGVRYTEDNATFFCGKIQDVRSDRMYPRGPVNPFFCGKIDFSADPPPPPVEEDEEEGYRGLQLLPFAPNATNGSNATLANGTNGNGTRGNGTRSVNITRKNGNTTEVVTKQVNESKPASGNEVPPAASGNASGAGNVSGNSSNATPNGTAGEETIETVSRRQAAKDRNESAVNDTKFSNLTNLTNGTDDNDKQESDPDDLLEDRPREDCIRWKSGECAEWKSDAVQPIEIKNQSTPVKKKVTKAEKAKRKKWSESQECHRVCRPETPPPPPPPPPPPAPVKIVNDMLCAARENCSTCVSKKLFPLSEFPQPCGWCEDTQSCLAGGPDGPSVNSNFSFEGNCSNWQPDFCQGESCASIGKTGGCAACTTNPFCGYCKTTKSCVEGDIDGPMLGSCLQWNSEFCDFEDLEEEKAKVSKVLFTTLTGKCPNGTLFINGTCQKIQTQNATQKTNVTVKGPLVLSGMDKLKGYFSGKKAKKMFVKQINEDNTTEAKLLTVTKDGAGVETSTVVDGSNITHLNALDPAVRAENRARKANATKAAAKQINVTDMPKPELTNHPNQTVVSEFKVNINMSLISGPNNTAHRNDLESDFKEDIAEATNCRASRIKVLDIRAGVIQYAVLPAKNWTGTQTPLEIATKVRVLLKNRKSKIYKGTVTSKVDAKFYPQITPREVPCDADEDKLSHGDKVAKKTDKLGNEMLHITLKDGTVVEAQEWGVAVAPSEAGVKKQRCRKSAAKAKGEALANAAANGTASLLEEMEVDC